MRVQIYGCIIYYSNLFCHKFEFFLINLFNDFKANNLLDFLHMKHVGDYIITGGTEGKKRLNVLSDVMHPYTLSLLEAHGFTTGNAFLDVGCGGGNVARMAATIVGNTGKVVATDFDAEIIALNKEEASANGITNLTYTALNAYDIDFEGEFDIAYSRFLLSHLASPEKALEKMLKGVKPGRKIIVEDVHFSGHFCYPQSKAFSEYVTLYSALAYHRGQNPDIGPELPELFRKAGIQDIDFDVIQPAYSTGAGKRMAYITLDKISEPLIAQGLATKLQIETLLKELDAFTDDETTIMSLPRIFRVWGSKP